MSGPNENEFFDVPTGSDPNDPSKTGHYDDEAMKIPLEKRTGPFQEFPKAPDPKPFKITGE